MFVFEKNTFVIADAVNFQNAAIETLLEVIKLNNSLRKLRIFTVRVILKSFKQTTNRFAEWQCTAARVRIYTGN